MQLTADELAFVLNDPDTLQKLALFNRRKACRVTTKDVFESAQLLTRAREFETARREVSAVTHRRYA